MVTSPSRGFDSAEDLCHARALHARLMEALARQRARCTAIAARRAHAQTAEHAARYARALMVMEDAAAATVSMIAAAEEEIISLELLPAESYFD